MKKTSDKTTLLDAYRVPGFRLRRHVDGYDLAKPAFVITLDRRSKKRCAVCAAKRVATSMIRAGGACATLGAGIRKFGSILKCGV